MTTAPLWREPILGDEHPADYLNRIGRVFARFDQQSSGNISYGVKLAAGERFFVKTAGDPNDGEAALDHGGRIALLRNAVQLAGTVSHPLLPTLHCVSESVIGPMLVYDWADGELVGVSSEQRSDPSSSYQRFRALPSDTIIEALGGIIDLHETLAAQGWIACDFYDGCLIFDFATRRLTVVDLDTYHQGAFTNTMGRMFGSTRFMAPEEFELGATIDERTTVFTLGRMGAAFLSDGSLDPGPFRGPSALHAAMVKACQPDKADRYPTVAAFARAWREALTAA